MKKKLPLLSISIWIIFLIGAGAFLYPTISNLIAQQNSTRKTNEYTNTISNLSSETIENEKQKAIECNKSLTYDSVIDPFTEDSTSLMPKNYLDTLNISDDGVMCAIEIPKINVNLPVYHGVSQEVLDKAVGHIYQTSLPIGGIGNHCVLTGHTGLPHAKLFTDLTKLETNDIFIIKVLNETLVYKIDNISVVLPSDVEKLKPVFGKDYVTLVTCTPYGINSHRLLVRGERTTENAEELIEAEKSKFTFWDMIIEYQAIFIVIALLLLLIAISVIYKFKSKFKQHKMMNLAILFGVLLIVAFGCYAIWDSNRVYHAASAANYEMYKPTDENKDSTFQELKEINPEVFAWLTVYGTHIDYPVVQGEDNFKYINKNPKNKSSTTGSIFLDCNNNNDFSDFSNIMYGHHMEKNVMFGEIGQFEDKAYFENRRYGSLYYNNQTYGLEFFAFTNTDAYDYSIFRTKIIGQENRQEYINTLLSKSVHIRENAAITADDKLVLLTTCSPDFTNDRNILIGRITNQTYDDKFKIENITGISAVDKMISFWLQMPLRVRIIIIAFLLLLILLVIIIKYIKRKKHSKELTEEDNK